MADWEIIADLTARYSHALSVLRLVWESRRRLQDRVAELERERADARRMHDESPGECYHCPRCQDADETEQDVLRARIAELEATGVAQGSDWMAKANRDSLRSLLDTVAKAQGEPLPVPWRCIANATRANLFAPDDHRAVWCTLPNGHAGWHHGEIEDQVPSGIEGFTKTRTSHMHWSDGQPEVDRG
ncbi:hypothetical protein [Nocardia tengchongensis]|uniref:hypothetical protein n=1 Tax=Nocardia tengchongensis TaxID=2055889 RepID=UPI003652CA22